MLNAEITGKKSAVSSGPPNNHNTVAHPDVWALLDYTTPNVCLHSKLLLPLFTSS
jgi:hypothetical protein